MNTPQRIPRVLGAVLILAGLVCALAGIGSSTWWRTDTVLAPSAGASTTVLVTAPGMLQTGGTPVSIAATGPAGSTVVLVVGRTTDVQGWLGASPYSSVTGLSSRTALRVVSSSGSGPESTATASAPAPSDSSAPVSSAPASSAPASSAPASSATASSPASSAPVSSPSTAATAVPSSALALTSPAGSDMWLAEASGDTAATLVWTGTDDQVVLLAALVAADGSATGGPALSLHWDQPEARSWLWPGVIAGVVLLVAGVILTVRGRRRTAGEPDLDEQPDTDVEQARGGSKTAESDDRDTERRPVWRRRRAVRPEEALLEEAPSIPLARQEAVPKTAVPDASTDPALSVPPSTAPPSVADDGTSAESAPGHTHRGAVHPFAPNGGATEPASEREQESVPSGPATAGSTSPLSEENVVVGRHTSAIPIVKSATPPRPPVPAPVNADGEAPMTRRRLRELRELAARAESADGEPSADSTPSSQEEPS